MCRSLGQKSAYAINLLFYTIFKVDLIFNCIVWYVVQGVFFFSCIWSVGATLDADGRPKFDMLFRGLLEKEFPDKVQHPLIRLLLR